MRPLLRLVGPWGAVVLGVTGLAGVLLAVHGWAGWHGSSVPGAIGGTAAGQPTTSVSAGAAPGPAKSTAGTSRPAPSGTPGPLLSSQPFAPYAYQIWPGHPSSAAQTALAGLAVTVHPQGTGLSVVAKVNGQPGSAHSYPGGARVYVIEASLGDDSGNTDYNLGDDGLVVTDPQGRIVS